MTVLPTIRILVIDDEEAVIIGDESEDEIEILAHDFSPETPSRNDSSSRSSSHTSPNTYHHSQQSSKTGNETTTSPPGNHRSLEYSPFRNPQVSRKVRTPSDPDDDSITFSLSPRRISRSTIIETEQRRSSSSTSRASTEGAKFGLSVQPIELEETNFLGHYHQEKSGKSPEERQFSKDGSKSPALSNGRSGRGPQFEGDAIQLRELIDLDELENFDDLWNDEEDLQILRVEERKRSEHNQKSFQITSHARNPSISAPMFRIPEWKHKNLLLRPSKTVELHDGDFLHITEIIQNSTYGDVVLRGQRLQRCRSMNGLLEKKLNELCFFYEVDLDDPRPAGEQSAVEVPVDKVQRLRNLRKTNHIFPLGRNLEIETFRTQLDAAVAGGLTARWKYTCTYSAAADRWHNNPKERSLEFLHEDECARGFGGSDAARRIAWRGETTTGGAHRLELDGKQFTNDAREESVVSLTNSASEPESDCVIIEAPLAYLKPERLGKRNFQSTSFTLPAPKRPRRASSTDGVFLKTPSREKTETIKFENGDEVEITSKELSTLCMEEHQSASCRNSTMLDLVIGSSSRESQRESSTIATSSQGCISIEFPATIDLALCDLITPAPTGTVRCISVSVEGTIIRSPGQMLTYGDAFCGAGGTTRGAEMAGLRVCWGFDHWNHACSTWRANFPQATCYELSSQQFVGGAQGSKYHKPIDMKVDILHLSPPCQYFSPAHTVNCPSDDMNVASLYAVGPVIKAAKPRVVTLEQTFGIVAARFRKYFNSLIQMFTALSFSVRWAIVPLAQWGLPQRRYRLIIIAACPGELLPAMPIPTHCDPSSPSFETTTLPPFMTVNNTLSSIPPDAPDHDPSSLFFPHNKCLRPWDGNAILPRAMTTSGGQNYHPSGKRDFTLREYAALQGFPPNHVFQGSYVKKQIGNAVPPVVAKVLFESIRRQLDERDGVVDKSGWETIVID